MALPKQFGAGGAPPLGGTPPPDVDEGGGPPAFVKKKRSKPFGKKPSFGKPKGFTPAMRPMMGGGR